MISVSSLAPLAIHISDGVLTPLGWGTAWLLAVGLVAFSAWRVRDEMIPRIALLTSAFFVSSLIHVPVPSGPRTHLLLNGLLGILLGRHAPLAIGIGLFLQAALFAHGGYTSLGANIVIMSVPALLAWGLFSRISTLTRNGFELLRTGLVFLSSVLFFSTVVFVFAALWTLPLGETENLDFFPAVSLLAHPLVPVAVFVGSCLVCHLERRWDNGPLFPIGVFLGGLAVLVTIALNGAALLFVGMADWHTLVLLTCVLHLPLAVIEGIVVGFALGFLAKVKPELIPQWQPPVNQLEPEVSAMQPTAAQPVSCTPPLVLALLGLLAFANTSRAHRIDFDYTVDRAKKSVRIEAFTSTDSIPKNAKVTVRRADGSLFVEGRPNVDGVFVFRYAKAETLTVVLEGSPGHRAEHSIPRDELAADLKTNTSSTRQPRRGGFLNGEVIGGVAFVLALAALFLSYRNSRAVKVLEEKVQRASTTTSSQYMPDAPSTMIPSPSQIEASDETIRLVPPKKEEKD